MSDDPPTEWFDAPTIVGPDGEPVELIRLNGGELNYAVVRHADPVPLQPTKDGNVIAYVRLTLEYPIECDPSYLEMTHDSDMGDVTRGTWHRCMGTWCGDNITDELEAALELVRTSDRYATINSAMNGGCLCEFVVNHDAFVNAMKVGKEPGRRALEEAVRRAKATGMTCAARYEYRAHGEPFDWRLGLVCNREPGHDEECGEWRECDGGEWNVLYGSEWPGGRNISRWSMDLASPDDSERCIPSPWTAEELGAWKERPDLLARFKAGDVTVLGELFEVGVGDWTVAEELCEAATEFLAACVYPTEWGKGIPRETVEKAEGAWVDLTAAINAFNALPVCRAAIVRMYGESGAAAFLRQQAEREAREREAGTSPPERT